MSRWAVVTTLDGRPLEVDGPYQSRADARDIKRQLDEDDRLEGVTNRRAIIVPLARLMTSGEINAYLASQRKP